ncbi:MAG: Nif11-like leader peptide family natural product precursor [Atopobiaceae bacterium]|nr:Nif11-like leader peptide family natural product precursor [Atopobiaceae bacterium]
MRYEELTSDQQKKIAACQTPEEVLALAKESGYTLTDDELNEVASGGGAWGGGTNGHCPNCGSTSYHTIHTGTVNQQNVCNKCSCVWG